MDKGLAGVNEDGKRKKSGEKQIALRRRRRKGVKS